MKKIFKMLTAFIISISLTGCVKMDMEMKINKDKSMNLTIYESFDTKLIGDIDVSQMYSVSEFEEKGFYAEKFEENGRKGYKYTKSIPNIDEISTFAELETLDLEKSLTEDDQVIFNREKGFIKDKYSASFKYDNSKVNNLEEMSFGKADEYNENCIYEYDGDMLSINCTSDDVEIDQVENKKIFNAYIKDKKEKMKKINESMELNFKLKLPYKSRSNNATSKSGKTLTWDLTKTQDIKFEFEIYNMGNLYKTIGFFITFIGIIVAAVFVILKLKKQTPPTDNNKNNQDLNFDSNNVNFNNESTNFTNDNYSLSNMGNQNAELNNQFMNSSNFNWQNQNHDNLNTNQEVTPTQSSNFVNNISMSQQPQSINSINVVQSNTSIETSNFINNQSHEMNNMQQTNNDMVQQQNNQFTTPINEPNMIGSTNNSINNAEASQPSTPHIDIPPML